MFSVFRNFSRTDVSQVIRSRFLWPIWRGNWILGRHACLGQDVINLTGIKTPIFNIQKGRVDFWLSCMKQSNMMTRTADIAPFLSRRDMIPILRQQEYCNNIPKHPPLFVYMDSLSELVDQLFIHKINGWGACCYYSDINHNDEFDNIFEGKGLLDINELESGYKDFFDLIRARYGDVPIVFLHFPSALEFREKFLGRGQAILSVIEKLATQYSRLYSIKIDEFIVSQPAEVAAELKSFPYHYNKETYIAFYKVLTEVLLNFKDNAYFKTKA